MTSDYLEVLDNSLNAIRADLNEESECGKDIIRSFEQLRRKFSPVPVFYALDKYIDAELDFRTPGNRGLGRMTGYIPRLAAYFRTQVSQLSPDDLSTLHALIKDLLLRGYLACLAVHESDEPLKDPAVTSGKTLYELLIPRIYGFDWSQMSQDVRKLIAIFCDSAFSALREFFQKHGMKGGGLFSKDKTNEIIFHYPMVGFFARSIEILGQEKVERLG